MSRPAFDDRLATLTEAAVSSINGLPVLHRLGHGYLPNRETVHSAVRCLLQLIFPGYFGRQGLTKQALPYHVGELMGRLTDELYEPVRYCLRFRENAGDCPDAGARCDAEAERIVLAFLERLPEVRRRCASDVAAHYDGDPAASSPEEVVFSYPGLYAVAVQRMAHELYRLQVPLLPRIMTEFAHGRTGIDIHPGAKLGERLFIDHGTGVVIGETCVIGVGCKLYQGVTLGALAPAKGQQLRGQQRHPSIGDDVTIYAGATILGGGNVFLTASVPPDTRVVAEPPSLRYRNGRGATQHADIDFQI